MSSAQLRSLISKAPTISKVLEILSDHGAARLDVLCATAAVHRLAVLRLRQPLPASLHAALEQSAPELKPPQLTQQAWALGRLGGSTARALLPQLAARAKALGGGAEGRAPPALAPALASLAWAAATLRTAEHFPGIAAASTLMHMRPQDAANTLWAAAVLRTRAPLAVRLSGPKVLGSVV
mmetsp:Transcript_28358/g.94139  ORF Transcript_28358/g.94139 Transcript_28358/m.94139 type:complete len:181 (+) Transcript_28358:184-726(+)